MDMPDNLRPNYAIKNDTGTDLTVTSQIFNKDGSPYSHPSSSLLPTGETEHFVTGRERPEGCEEIITISWKTQGD